jgi:hypothetical protein
MASPQPPSDDTVELLAEFMTETSRRRITAGLSQGALGVLIGYDRTYVNKVERGAIEPTGEAARRIDEALRANGEIFRRWQALAEAKRRQKARRSDRDRGRGLYRAAVGTPVDFFISYTGADQDVAEWIAWQLESAGYTITIQAWDFRPGSEFVTEMQQALVRAQRVLAVLSPAYMSSAFARAEWNAALAMDPTGAAGRLLPVRVAEVALQGLDLPRIYLDLVGLPQEEAKRQLLAAVRAERAKPAVEPDYPERLDRVRLVARAKPTVEPDYPSHLEDPASPPKDPQPSVRLKAFLCHSSSDKRAVRQLYARLRADGISPWLDEEDILPGQVWDKEIRKAIRSCDVVLVCLSKSSVSKVGYIQKEITDILDVADEQPEGAIFLIPVRLEQCKVPDRIGRRQWVDLFDEEAGYERLLRALRYVLPRPQSIQPPGMVE